MAEVLDTFERLCREVGGRFYRTGSVASCILPDDSSVKLDFDREELKIELFAHGEFGYESLPAEDEIDISIERVEPTRGIGGHFFRVDYLEKVGGKLPHGGTIEIEVKNGKVKAVSIRPR